MYVRGAYMPYKGSASALARHGVVQSATRLAAEGRAIRGLAAMNGRSSQMRKPCPTVRPQAAKQAPARTAAGSAFRLDVSGRGTVGDLLRPGSSGDSAAPSRSRRTRLSPSCALGHRAGPYRVYDAAFYTRYQDALNNPVRWQAEADQRGIQTVILLHWWPIRLCRFLLADRRWALVYFDETVFVFLRREGNEALIAEAVAAFATLRPQIEERLLSPVSSWGWPVFRAMGLVRYALALGIMGNVDDAARFNERYLDLRPEPHEEARVALDLARYHIARGETGLAHLYLRRATRAEPDNPDIASLSGC